MRLSLEQYGVFTAIVVGATTGSWNLYQILLARRKADQERISLLEQKEHRLTMLESSLVTFGEIQNDLILTLKDHSHRIDGLENSVRVDEK